jgi:hypothetical protein
MLKDGATHSVMMGAIDGSKNLQNDLGAYMMAKLKGDDTLFDKYVDKAYDSSADYWKLKTVLDEDGNVISYAVDWDNRLDLTVENADGTASKLADFDQIRTETGIDKISQWFSDSGLAFGDEERQRFVALGTASEATKALIDAINKEQGAEIKNKDSPTIIGALAANFTGSIDALLASGLRIGGFDPLPNQEDKYDMMPDSHIRTTLFGNRLVTLELKAARVLGELYHWGTVKHDAEDITGGKIVQTPVPASNLSMGWREKLGFNVAISTSDGYTLTSNHLSSASGMNLLEAMLRSGSTEDIAAGLQFATIGTTGTASTGIHNHLVGKNASGFIAPSSIFAAMGISVKYTDKDTGLSGYSDNTAYNDPKLLQDIRANMSLTERQAYVNAHSELFRPSAPRIEAGRIVHDVFNVSTMTYKTQEVINRLPVWGLGIDLTPKRYFEPGQ